MGSVLVPPHVLDVRICLGAPGNGRTLSRSVDAGMLTSHVVRNGDDAWDNAFGDMGRGGYLTEITGHLDTVTILDATLGSSFAVDPCRIVVLDLGQPLAMGCARVRMYGNLIGSQVQVILAHLLMLRYRRVGRECRESL